MKTIALIILGLLMMFTAVQLHAEETIAKKPEKQTFDKFTQIVDTNIFIRRKAIDKNHPTNGDGSAKPAEAPPPPPVNKYLLCGIIIENDDRFTAMVEDSQTHTLRSLHIGDKLDVFEIPSMTISNVVLNMPDGRAIELFIGQTIDANGHVLQSPSWIPTANTSTSGSGSTVSPTAPASENELSILEKLRRKRESQLNKDKP